MDLNPINSKIGGKIKVSNFFGSFHCSRTESVGLLGFVKGLVSLLRGPAVVSFI